MARFRESLAILDQYYVPTRYPNGLPGGIPSDVYTRTQAAEAVEVARQVVAVVCAELQPRTAEREPIARYVPGGGASRLRPMVSVP